MLSRRGLLKSFAATLASAAAGITITKEEYSPYNLWTMEDTPCVLNFPIQSQNSDLLLQDEFISQAEIDEASKLWSGYKINPNLRLVGGKWLLESFGISFPAHSQPSGVGFKLPALDEPGDMLAIIHEASE